MTTEEFNQETRWEMAGGGLTVTSQRFWELDVLRGIAVVGMVGLHIFADLDFLKFPVRYDQQVWYIIQTTTAGLFLLLVGVSLTLGLAKANRVGMTKSAFLKKQLRRGITIFSWGMFITLVTRLVVGGGYVVFGILHLIGLTIVLSYPLLRYQWLNLCFGMVLIGLGIYLDGLRIGFPWLVWLGFIPKGFYSVDYFPVLPWSGAIVLGIFLGKLGYRDHTRTYYLPNLSGCRWICGLSWLGRHSLVIYLIHQPILLMGLLLIRGH